MMWNSSLGVKPKLTISATGSELRFHSVRMMPTMVDNGDIKMMIHYGNSGASVVEEEQQRQQRDTIVDVFYIRFELAILTQQTTNPRVSIKTSSSWQVACTKCTKST